MFNLLKRFRKESAPMFTREEFMSVEVDLMRAYLDRLGEDINLLWNYLNSDIIDPNIIRDKLFILMDHENNILRELNTLESLIYSEGRLRLLDTD